MSVNININENHNINYNGINTIGDDGFITNQLSTVAIATLNGLVLYDSSDSRVIQTFADYNDPRRYWIMTPGRIQNLGTGRYIGLAEPINENGIPLATFYDRDNITTRWTIETVGSNQHTIVNQYTGKVFDVPENSPMPGVVIIQYRRKVPIFEKLANQKFEFYEI